MEPEKDLFEELEEKRESLNWFNRMIQSIHLWWEHEGSYLFIEFVRSIKSILYWLPIISKDRNWDYIHILKILKHKLLAQSKHIKESDRHITSVRDSEKIMICVRLIDKIIDDFYRMEYNLYHKSKYWFEKCSDNPTYSTFKHKELEENFDDYFNKYPLIYKKVMLKNNIRKNPNKSIIAMNIADINHDRAKRLLFKILENQIERWWV